MFKEGQLAIVESKTSCNNGKLVKIIGQTNGKNKDIFIVIRQVEKTNFGKKFYIKESSLREVTPYDIVRNMTDNELNEVIKNSVKKKLKKKFK